MRNDKKQSFNAGSEIIYFTPAFFSDAIEHTEKNANFIFLKREYHFCFLIYHIAKHLYSTGAGIRMFLDICLLWNYLFLSAENMLQIMPSVEKHRWLLPVAWIKRWWLGAFRHRSHSIHTMKSMFKDDAGRGHEGILDAERTWIVKFFSKS